MDRAKSACAICSVALIVGLGFLAHAEAITVSDVWRLTEVARVQVGFFAGTIHFLSNTEIAINDEQRGSTVVWDSAIDGEAGLADEQLPGKLLAVTADLTALALSTRSGNVLIQSADPMEERLDLCTLEGTPYPRAAFSPDGSLLAVTNRRDEIELWDIASGTLDAVLVGHNSNLFDVAFASDGAILATAGGWSGSTTDEDSCVNVWDVAAGELIVSLPTADIGDNHAIVFAEDDGRLISGGTGRLVAWDTATWQRTFDSFSSFAGNYGLATSPNQELLAAAYHGATVRLINLSTMRTARDIRAIGEPLDVAFSPDGSRLAASYPDGTVIVWMAP